MVDLFSVLVSVSDISMPFYSTHSLVGPYAMTAMFMFRYGARPSAGHYTDSRYARDQSSATHLKFLFCIVVLTNS